MSSSLNGGRGLPAIEFARGRRPSNDRKAERQPKPLPGRSVSPQRGINISQTSPRAHINPSSRLHPRQDSAAGSGHRPTLHNRTGRSLSIEDVDPSRNWNSEGGRPKRGRTFSERSNSGRLLQRSSITASGELIPFQRAPRDGSYESRLPVRKRSVAQKLAKESSSYSSTDREERLAVQDRPGRDEEQRNDSIGNAEESRSLSFDEKKKYHGRTKVAAKSVAITRDGSRVGRRLSSQKGGSGFPKGLSANAPGGCAQSDPTSLPSSTNKQSMQNESDQSEQDSSASAFVSGLEDKHTGTTNNIESSLEPDESRSQPVGSTIDNFLDENGMTLDRAVHVTSPSAEFKAAAQLEDLASTATDSANQTALRVAIESNLRGGSNESDFRINQQLSSSPQPNSVIRRRLSSVGTGDTSQIQSGQVLVSPSVVGDRPSSRRTPNISQSEDHTSTGDPTTSRDGPTEHAGSTNENEPVNQQQSSSGIYDENGASPRSILAQPPPIGNSTPSAGSTVQQARLNCFGRRVRRVQSSDSVETSLPDEARPAPPEPPGEEQCEGTNHQRHRFFSASSRDMSGSHREIQIPVTPNRDLLYGQQPSPPLLRRHRRTHFGSGTSNSLVPQSAEEVGVSTSCESSRGSSISSDGHEDLFRTASGNGANFSPVLHSGAVLHSSSPASDRQGSLHEAAAVPSIATQDSFGPSGSSSPRRPHLRPSGHSLDGLADIERSPDYNEDNFTFSVEEQHLGRDARRRHLSDRSEAVPRLLSHRGRQPQRELSRGAEVEEDMFGSSQDGASQRSSGDSPLRDATLELPIPLLGSRLFSPLGIAPGMLLSLLIRTRREYGQEFMELLLENMMLNVLAHHLFEGDQGGNEDGINGAPPPATQEIIDSLNEIPALESHIEKELKCAICHSEYELYETLAELPCQHFFHPTCVAVWLKKSGTCPVCRFHLLPQAR